MIHNSGKSQHTRTGHEFLTRGKVPVSVAETAAEIHLGRREIRVVNIVGIRNTSARAAGRLDKIVTKQIIPLFRGYACAVGFASVIGSGAGVGERRIVISCSNCDIGIRIYGVCHNCRKRITVGFACRITSRALSDHSAGNAVRKLGSDFYLHRVGRGNIHRLCGKLLHRLRLIHHNAVHLISVVDALRGKRERRIVISACCGR